MQMQAGDIQNMSEPLDNLKSFLSIAGEMILKLASKNMSEVQKMRVGSKVIQIQGSQASATLDKLTGKPTENVSKILPFENLIVDIIPGTAYTDIQVRQDLITLKEVGVQIPDEILIDTFKL
jgi:Na+-transporting NADH:ubiquinone oxidoreductase subunit NqrC